MIRLMLALMVCGCFMPACCSIEECSKCDGQCQCAAKCEKAGAGAESAQAAEATHVITFETNYYVSGPQQARPPEGKFAAGTKVSLIGDAGSYSLVRALDGRQGYVSTDALKALK